MFLFVEEKAIFILGRPILNIFGFEGLLLMEFEALNLCHPCLKLERKLRRAFMSHSSRTERICVTQRFYITLLCPSQIRKSKPEATEGQYEVDVSGLLPPRLSTSVWKERKRPRPFKSCGSPRPFRMA